ncbi:rhomboid family intramembrane serine protease, partial [Rhizobium johnstonii]|uniref:rhomboid family intramembrane serine protease n=1 Tax=Rhizobium johnstonii TaxID=3019933 RepID=UPI003F9A3448
MSTAGFVYLLQLVPGLGIENLFFFTPDAVSTAYVFQPWRLITAVFLHASILHIALNMYTLLIFGQLMKYSARKRHLPSSPSIN